jgi:2'-5' RNA ligase
MTIQPPGDEILRLFVAIEMPEAWKEAFKRVQKDVQTALDREPDLSGVRVRWVRPEGIHLTLKFLGEVPASRLERITWGLESAVPEPPGFELALGRIGSFSDRRAPSVIWAGIQDQPLNQSKLGKLVEQVETWMASAGFPHEKRAFAPHLTLARLPERLEPALRQRIAEVTAGFSPEAQPFTVDTVSLMRSHLGPGGARYERLAAYPD